MAAEKIDALELDIKSKLTTENLDKLLNYLKKLRKELDNVNAKKPADQVKQLGDSSNQAANGVNNLLNKTVKFAAVIALLNKVSDVIGDSVAKSLTYQKTLNMFNTALGEYADNATKYGNTVHDALGIDIAGWQKAEGVFQTLIKGFGIGGDQAAYMSQNLTQLTYDLASYWDITSEEAAYKVKSALAGRLQPIRAIGYDLSQSKLTDIAKNPAYYGKQTYAINEQTGAIESNTVAIDDNTQHKIVNFNQLTQQEKVQLRYIALMTQSTAVQGNYARALQDPANQMKIFKEQTEATSRALGNIFIPMLNQALPYLTAFAQLAEEAFKAIAKWFGFSMPDMSNRMDISDTVEPYNDVVEATGRAAKNAKKLRDYTIGIDELNVLKKPDDTAGGGGAGGEQSNLSNMLTPGYDFLSQAISNSIKQAKADLDLLRADFKKKPLTVTATVLWEGGKELGSKLWELILGKSPEQLGIEAAQQGNTVGEQFFIAFYEKWENDMTSFWSNWFGTPDELAERARKAGNTVGVQFAAELGKAIAEFINSNPVFKELYKIGTGKDIEKELAAFTRVANGQKVRSSGGGSASGGVRTGSQYIGEPPAKTVIASLGNTAANEARKLGEAYAKAYAEGLKSQNGEVQSAGTTLYNSGKNGANNNGNAVSGYKYVAQNQAYAFTSNLASTKTKASAYTAGQSIASQASAGSKTYTSGFKTAGEQSGAGYVGGVNNKTNLQKAREAGATIASNALKKLKEVLGIHSPSRAFGEAGMYSVEGYAEYMKKYTYLATNAAENMAKSALKAINTADTALNSNMVVPASGNTGYNVGMANQGAMASLVSNIYNAVVNGMSTASTEKGDTIVMIDGKEIYRVVQKEARKSGVSISNGAFSTI